MSSNSTESTAPELIRTEETGGYGQGWIKENPRKFYSPPSERNKQPILEVLQIYLDDASMGKVLEIASGSGQNVQRLAAHFSKLTFQPTEYAGFSSPLAPQPQKIDEILGSINEYTKDQPHVLPAIELDAHALDQWPKDPCLAVVAINLLHISPLAVGESVFTGSGQVLQSQGYLFLYGPFKFGPGPATPESNAKFDEKLAALDPAFGIRSVEDLDGFALKNGLKRLAAHEVPANNYVLVYQKA